MVELLAPAGNMECFYAAINAGADAIYLAGEKYGARAYAGNFSEAELLDAISTAHLCGKKIYLTINTLLKETELNDLVSFLRPYYNAGLHGVIVQDLGAMRYMQRVFPGLELHASTQMTVTGSYGADFLKSMGICRVVPARELSLDEIRQIKKDTGLEIECFIHGAMCYSYSGQCLFSSMLGARSGNRGRCAGPCRLPYDAFYDGRQLNKKAEQFQLGLKDLCTIEILPELIDAGIDSFKIEGRMKSPAYVYFVTSLYRKYIDLYIKNPKAYRVNPKDIDRLRECYSRGDMQSGYYKQHNGRNMVTLSSSGYASSQDFQEDKSLDACGKQLDPSKKCLINGYVTAVKNQNISLSVICGDETIYVEGETPFEATNRSATKADIEKQILKTGNTLFQFEELEIELEDGLFIPNKMLNELRREALDLLLELLVSKHHRVFDDMVDPGAVLALENTQQSKNTKSKPALDIACLGNAQLESVIDNRDSIRRVYFAYDLVLGQSTDIQNMLVQIDTLKQAGVQCYLRMPAVARKVVTDHLSKILDQNAELLSVFNGVCINNLELLGFFKTKLPSVKLVSDARFYCFQPETVQFFDEAGLTEHIVSYELHHSEVASLIKHSKKQGHEFVLPVYGRIPMMESAGCILKTNQLCQKDEEKKNLYLLDRYQKKLPVITHCDRCENTIYNSVVLSLHREHDKVAATGADAVLLDFTTESKKETARIITAYSNLLAGGFEGDVISDYTKGHFVKGVE